MKNDLDTNPYSKEINDSYNDSLKYFTKKINSGESISGSSKLTPNTPETGADAALTKRINAAAEQKPKINQPKNAIWVRKDNDWKLWGGSDSGENDPRLPDIKSEYGEYRVTENGKHPEDIDREEASETFGVDIKNPLKDIKRQPIFEKGGNVYGVEFDPKTGKLYAGSITNSGIMKEYEIDYDPEDDIDSVLQELYDQIDEGDLF